MEHIHLGQTYLLGEIEAYTTLFKEFRNVFSWSYEEMHEIDPSIIVHEIKNYLVAMPVCHKFLPMHPRKTVAVKVEVEKHLG